EKSTSRNLSPVDLRGKFFLFSDIKRFVNPSHNLATIINNIDVPFRQVFVAIGGGRADLIQTFIGQLKTSLHTTFAGPDKVDTGGLVPNHISITPTAHQQQHIHGGHHTVERTAKVCAHIIGVVPVLAHFDRSG